MSRGSVNKFLGNFLRSVGYFVLVLLFVLLFALLIPLLCFLSIPNYVYREMVKRTARLLKPSLGSMVTTLGAIYASCENFQNPETSLVNRVNLEKTLDLEKYIELFEKNVLNGLTDNGKLIYPELKQSLTKWCGFYFWKNDETFNLKEHIKRISLDLDTDKIEAGLVFEDALCRLHQQLASSPWPKGKPLWEILAVDHDQKTFLFTRTHHTLGDGFSISNAFCKCSLDQEIREAGLQHAKPTFPTRNNLQRFLFYIKFLIMGPLEAAKAAAYPLIFPSPFYSKGSSKKSLILNQKLVLDIPKIKDLKLHFGVSFTAVLVSVISGAIRDLLLNKMDPDQEFPKNLPCIAPFPLSSHPDKMRNLMTAALISFPIQEPDPIKRLLLSDRQLRQLKSSIIPLGSFVLLKILGSWPWRLVRICNPHQFSSLLLSAFPIATQPFDVCGINVSDVSLVVGNLNGGIGLSFLALSYVDLIKVSLVGYNSVLNEQELDQISKGIEAQIELLVTRKNY